MSKLKILLSDLRDDLKQNQNLPFMRFSNSIFSGSMKCEVRNNTSWLDMGVSDYKRLGQKKASLLWINDLFISDILFGFMNKRAQGKFVGDVLWKFTTAKIPIIVLCKDE